jgi:hypothetical protein
MLGVTNGLLEVVAVVPIVNETFTTCELLVAPEAVMVTRPEYEPTPKLPAFTMTVTVTGVVPVLGLKDSQLPLAGEMTLGTAVKGNRPPPEVERVNVWLGGPPPAIPVLGLA